MGKKVLCQLLLAVDPIPMYIGVTCPMNIGPL